MNAEAKDFNTGLITMSLKYINPDLEVSGLEKVTVSPETEEECYQVWLAHKAIPGIEPVMLYFRVAENGGSVELHDGDEWMPLTDSLLYEELWINRMAR